jgi:hypothetical protein
MNGGRKKWLTEMMVDDSKFLIAHCHMWRPHQRYLVRFKVSARPREPYPLQRLLARMGQAGRCEIERGTAMTADV